MERNYISDTVKYIGVDDKDLDLFESQYIIPNGVSYNSYLILDEKIAVMDTVDKRGCECWMANLEQKLQGRSPDYLVLSHLEPDHAGSFAAFLRKYPQVKLVGNAKTFAMLVQFFEVDLEERTVVVEEGTTLSLGTHMLQFLLAPMVHWPEVMVTYEKKEKILFSADGFGTFGTLDINKAWVCEARRYYFNIVGKYGPSVQTLLKKAAALDIQMICPLHGPVLKENLSYYIGKYQIWSNYEPEDCGILVAYASIHGNTARVAWKLAEILEAKGASKVVLMDLAREDQSKAVENAFRYDRLVLAAASYDAGVFPPMEEFLHHLTAKNYCKRTIAMIENGSWAPCAGKVMKAILENSKDLTLLEPMVTIKSAMKTETIKELEVLADQLLAHDRK